MSDKTVGFLISSLNAGGAERVVSLLANEMSLTRKVVVITLSNDPPFYQLNDSIVLKQLGVSNPSSSPLKAILSNLTLVYKIWALIKSQSIKHLICFMTTSNVLGIITGKFISKINVTISERANPNIEILGYWDFLRRKTYSFCDTLVVQSDEIKNYFKQFVAVHKIKIIPNPIKIISEKHFKKETIILTVGRIDRNKNQEQIIRSFARIKNNEWKLIVCGDGPLKSELKDLTTRLNIDNKVEFTGIVKNIEDYYERASVFAFSSLSEGFPNVLLEAMNHNCACISTDCPTGPGMLIRHNKNGFLIPSGNENLYDSYLQSLIMDENLRNNFVNNGQKVLQNYSMESIAPKWIV